MGCSGLSWWWLAHCRHHVASPFEETNSSMLLPSAALLGLCTEVIENLVVGRGATKSSDPAGSLRVCRLRGRGFTLGRYVSYYHLCSCPYNAVFLPFFPFQQPGQCTSNQFISFSWQNRLHQTALWPRRFYMASLLIWFFKPCFVSV